jgi:tetratricopeptide (TPR) repeat protein
MSGTGRVIVSFWLCGLFWFALQTVCAQQTKEEPPPPKGRPVLIPDDQTQKPSEDEMVDANAPDPAKADKHFEIGMYYLKMKKYDAAIIRFREAIRNKPDFAEAKWKFVETLATKKDWKNALEFSTSYLQDPNMTAYKDKLKKLQDTARKKEAATPKAAVK